MPAKRLALLVRVASQLLVALELAILTLAFVGSGRGHEPLLRTLLALAAAGAGWYQARIADEPLRRHWTRAMSGFFCLVASMWLLAGAVQLIW
jgi:hypothetical protein